MSQSPKPRPPKPCPICQVAMQAKLVDAGTMHSCQRCGLTITIKPSAEKNA